MMSLTNLWSETALQGISMLHLSGDWVEIAQVKQKNTLLSGNWVEIAQVRQEETLLSSNWVEVMYLVGADPEPDPVIPPPLSPHRRKIIMGISAIPKLVEDPVPPPVPPATIIDLSGEALSTTVIQLFFADMVGVTSYQYRLNGGAPALLAPDKRLIDLTPDTLYAIEVRGLNSSGPGDWSNLVNIQTWQPAVIDPNDIDGDGIPNVNDPDHPDYDPTHPDSDPDGDGIPNVLDDDDDGDGIPDVDDPDHPGYVPPPVADPVAATTSGGTTFYGYGGTFGDSLSITTNSGLTYEGSGGTAPYTYLWELEGTATLTDHNTAEVSFTETYAIVLNPNGGFTKFGSTVPKGKTLEHDLRCTVTDSLGESVTFVISVMLTCSDLN